MGLQLLSRLEFEVGMQGVAFYGAIEEGEYGEEGQAADPD